VGEWSETYTRNKNRGIGSRINALSAERVAEKEEGKMITPEHLFHFDKNVGQKTGEGEGKRGGKEPRPDLYKRG